MICPDPARRVGMAAGLLLAVAAWSPGARAGEQAPAMPAPEEVARLVGQLADPSFAAREAAQKALLELGCAQPEGVLALLPLESGDPEVREHCRILRWQIPLEALRRRMSLRAGTDEGLRRALADVLGTPSPETSEALLVLVERSGRGEDFAGVWTWLLENPEADLHAEAAGALGVLGCRSARPQLSALLEDPRPNIRCRAAIALMALGERALAPHFLKLMQDPSGPSGTSGIDDPAFIRDEAAIALVALHDPGVLPDLLKDLARISGEDRRRCAGVIVGLADRSVVPALVALLDPDDEIESPLDIDVAMALDALGEASASPKAVKIMEAMKKQEAADPNVTPQALGLDLGLRVNVPALVRLLEEPGVDLRTRAVIALRRLDDQFIQLQIVPLLKDPQARVRCLAIPALVEDVCRPMGRSGMGPPLDAMRSLIPVLEKMKEDPDETVRAAALKGLEEVGPVDAWGPKEVP